MKNKYVIVIYGCNDGDTVFEMELTDEEYEVVKKVSDVSVEAANYRISPTLAIRKKIA